MSPQTIDWKTDRTKFGDSRQLIWHFGKDGYTRDHVLKSHDLGIGVFEYHKIPYAASPASFIAGGGVVLAGGITTALGYKLKSDALKDYEPYELVRDPNDSIYASMSRQEVYNNANNKYRNSQLLRGIGFTITGIGTAYLVNQLLKNIRGKKGRLYDGEASASGQDFY